MALDDRNNDNRNSISGRGSRRKSEIQQIKQIPIHVVLERRGFTPSERKLSSAVFHDLPNLPGTTSVFYASRNKAWLCKYKSDGQTVTRSILDLWQILYRVDYPEAIRELREIAGINTGTRDNHEQEQGPAGDREDMPEKSSSPGEGALTDGGKMARMKARYDLLVQRTKEFDPEDIDPDRRAKARQAVALMDNAMKSGNERYFDLLAGVVELLVGVKG
jgi:hypothetical protein